MVGDAAKVKEVIDEIIDDLIIYGMDEIVVKREINRYTARKIKITIERRHKNEPSIHNQA